MVQTCNIIELKSKMMLYSVNSRLLIVGIHVYKYTVYIHCIQAGVLCRSLSCAVFSFLFTYLFAYFVTIPKALPRKSNLILLKIPHLSQAIA